MATTTPNFGWPVPTSTDLVKDGATAIEALGDSIDASLLDLKGGTTGQVLAKASGTDMDFSWVAQDDSNAIQNAIVDAKGDLIAATAADTPARLAVGANDTVLTADSSTATGLKWAAPASGGGMTLINTGGTALTGSTTTISTIPGTYNELIIYMVDFAITADSSIYLGFNADNTASNYQQFVNRGTGATDNSYVTNSDARIDLTGYGIDSGDQNNISVISIPNYASTIRKIVNVQSGFIQTSGAKAVTNNTTHYQTTSAIASLDFVVSGTTWSGGTVFVYGVK
jgi:hypothetical protein